MSDEIIAEDLYLTMSYSKCCCHNVRKVTTLRRQFLALFLCNYFPLLPDITQ